MQVASAQFTVNLMVTEPTCFGLPTGSITASADGGSAPYTYLWSTGATGATLNNITAGSYSVTVTDNTGASVVESTTVNQPTLLSVTLSANTCQVPFTITATGSGGNPPYTYNWGTGDSGSVIIVPGAGTYCVTMTDQSLCGTVNCITVDLNPLDVSVTTTGLTCPNSDDGTVEAIVTGGTPPYTYAWSNGATTASQTGLAAGTYTVTVTDSGGCSDSASGVVSAPPPLTSSISGTGPDCAGGSNGIATVTAGGGTPPYSFLWSTGSTNSGISGLSVGTYTVTITDDNGCEITDMITLEPVSNLEAMATATPESCPGANDGTATATALNGVPPYIYLWSNGGVTQTITGLAPGTYTVTIIDGSGCTAMASVVVEAAPPLEISLSSTDVTTCNASDGTATVDILQGLAPLSISWSTGATTATIDGLSGGTYGVTVTDANGCTATGSVVVTEPPAVAVSVTATPTVCPGESTGTAMAVVSGGTMPFTFSWNTGQTTQMINNLPAGTYTVVVTDANGCQAMASATIVESPQIQAVVSGTEIVCGLGETGEASVTATGGAPPYTYAWSTGETTESVDGLAEGIYTVSITDANGCMATAQFEIDVVDDFEVNVVGRDVLCNGDATGSILLTPSGGTPPYTYNWNTGQTTNEITNLTAGAYSVTVTEAGGCMIERTIVINEPPALGLAVSGTDINCPGADDGTASASASGGTPPYTYAWSNGATTADISGLAAGTYTVTATDANLCVISGSVTISEPPPFQGMVITVIDLLCAGDDNGSATVTVSGGTPPYTYAWSNGQTGATGTNLSAGNYTVTVTDANGCTDNILVVISEPPVLDVTASAVTGTTCDNATDGEVSVTAGGGTPPYTYAWSNGATTSTVADLPAGDYTVTVTDANGCKADDAVTINAFDSPSCSITVTQEITPAGNDGEAMVNVTGGTPPFSYQWSNGQTGVSATGLSSGTYSCVVTDANGCETSCEVTLAPPARLGDYVWLDVDRDGRQDPNEDGIPGVMVILQIPTDANPTNIDTTFTNNNGYYYFDVIPGEYKVTFIKPDGLTFSDPDQGSNDALDSDADPVMGMTGIYIIGPGEENLTIDAGLYPPCDNITDPGLIGPNQFLCGPGNDPTEILNIETPSGGSGNIEYLWMMSTQPGPFNTQTWTSIPGATGPSYDPPVLYETTYFTRCVRREDCTVYKESNIVTIEVGSVANAEINGPGYLCIDEPATFTAGPTSPNAVITWEVSGPATPDSGTGPSITITAGSFGLVTLTLQVVDNGCTATNFKTLTATSSPLYCAGPGQALPINVDVVDEEEGEVLVSWMIEELLSSSLGFTVEYSPDGAQFEALGDMNSPKAFLGSMNYYEFQHLTPKRGRNFYRIKVHGPSGEVFFSEIGEAILFNDSEVAMLYPNPTTDQVIIELFENFGEEVQVEVFSANGVRMLSRTIPEEVQRAEFDLSGFPAGVYFFNLRYSRSGVKVLKVLKH
ncbi:MAG: T9SS type A sorting domain-containing protein [Lewinellaceae bacterium]|nr:T9SS type A sorting domain-containing protein [Lewinellaceae bacterium]